LELHYIDFRKRLIDLPALGDYTQLLLHHRDFMIIIA